MSLQKLHDDMARDLFGMTKTEAIQKGICIDCKQPSKFYSEAGEKEYYITGLCEPCFDRITKEEHD